MQQCCPIFVGSMREFQAGVCMNPLSITAIPRISRRFHARGSIKKDVLDVPISCSRAMHHLTLYCHG